MNKSRNPAKSKLHILAPAKQKALYGRFSEDGCNKTSDKLFHFVLDHAGDCQPNSNGLKNSISNCEIYFPLFSETIRTILKIVSLHGLRR